MKRNRMLKFSIIFSRDGIETVACLSPDPASWDEVAHLMRKVRKEVQGLELAIKRVYAGEDAKLEKKRADPARN